MRCCVVNGDCKVDVQIRFALGGRRGRIRDEFGGMLDVTILYYGRETDSREESAKPEFMQQMDDSTLCLCFSRWKKGASSTVVVVVVAAAWHWEEIVGIVWKDPKFFNWMNKIAEKANGIVPRSGGDR